MLPEKILRQERELPPEVLESRVARSVAGEAGRINIRFQRSASVPSSFEALHDALGAQMQTPLGSRGCPEHRNSISPARSDYTGRISKLGNGSLRMALYDVAQIMVPSRSGGCSQLKSWAGADRQHEQGQGGARRPTRGEHARHASKRRLLSWTGSAKQFGAGYATRPTRNEVL
jgi:hypothetical protein